MSNVDTKMIMHYCAEKSNRAIAKLFRFEFIGKLDRTLHLAMQSRKESDSHGLEVGQLNNNLI
jgi:hypothetical protein